MENFKQHIQQLHQLFCSSTLTTLQVQEALFTLATLTLNTLKQGYTEDELTSEWRTLQAFFYHNQIAHHLCWPQESSIYIEALKLTNQEPSAHQWDHKQPPLF